MALSNIEKIESSAILTLLLYLIFIIEGHWLFGVGSVGYAFFTLLNIRKSIIYTHKTRGGNKS